MYKITLECFVNVLLRLLTIISHLTLRSCNQQQYLLKLQNECFRNFVQLLYIKILHQPSNI